MVRVITQDTYDEVVKENISEFNMSPEDAIIDAVAQFMAQGVDLSNIIKESVLASGDDHLVTKTVKTLEELGRQQKSNDDDIVTELNILKAECNKDIAHRVKAGRDGAYKILLDLLETRRIRLLNEKNEKDANVTVNVLLSLIALMDNQPDLLDELGIDLMKSTLDKIDKEDILIATLRWISTCCIKHEMNRQKLFAQNLTDTLKNILEQKKNKKLLSEALSVIRKFTLDDDVRVEFGKAHEHSRELGIQMLDTLALLIKDNTKPPLVSELMVTAATLLVRHELCAKFADHGLEVLVTILADNFDDVTVAQQATKLITALAGNDDVKRALVNCGLVPVVVALLSRHETNSSAAALILKCIAAISLREPDHGRQLLQNGAPEAIVHCMKVHQDNANVQKNACWAIRNMVSRCREYNDKFRDLGVEDLLNAAHHKFGAEFGFDIKSALRDLECEVKLDEQWSGKGVQITN